MKNKTLRADRLLLALVATLALLVAPPANAQSESTNTNDTSYIQPLWGGLGLPISGGETSGDEGTTSDGGFTATSSGIPLEGSPGPVTSQSTTPFTGTYTWGSAGNVTNFAYNGTDIANLTEGNFTKNGVTSSSSSGNFRASNWAVDTAPGALGGSVDLGKYF
jgi:hypothetical protein